MPWIENCALADIEKGYHYDPGPNSILIQIVDQDMDFPTPKYAFREVHQFKFLDIEDDDSNADTLGMLPAHAISITRVLKNALANRSNVLVHCVAGICRSGAVTEVGVMMGFEDTEKYRCPNTRVKRMLMLELGWGYGTQQGRGGNFIQTDSGVLIPKGSE